ncbi:phosphoribosyltransferase [Pseudomonas sp. PIC25]|uniref:phosphoribosyltransferase n=1 Tax=Pseudomonas sp. PIC25 TaxID=1958773 RepID=UPI000BAB58CF|nr:phosphoribosyltransferase [Pseudomonas sp. PIC25]PAU64523.1 phosphoribosyltransferase [Pseudomonas sp. PIC25]
MRAPARSPHLFPDRHSAGLELAEALAPYAADHPLVLALPRGGVPVAYEIARILKAPLDLVLVRKIGAPGYEELGLGAVIDGADPQWVLNEEVMRQVHPPEGWFEAEMQRQLVELERRRRLYCGDRPAPNVGGHVVIVVDDGIATGGTVRAVLKGLAKAGPSQLVLAVPVGPRDVIEDLRSQVDELVCLAMPEPFIAVGHHYADFAQTTDDEVIALLARSRVD